ncbi:MAG: RnfABCDGE type electron transport complex subunit C [Firmicutes bacterium]|nr:RnfABCDGE type electron transport complex subunit C [Bacillota bacterium]
MKQGFRGGVYLTDYSELRRPTEPVFFDPPDEMVYPLTSWNGKTSKPVVAKGEAVLVGQLIAEADGEDSSNLFCSCSGTVRIIEKRRTLSGRMQECIVVDNDGEYTECEGFGQKTDISELGTGEILKRAADAGVVTPQCLPAEKVLAVKDPGSIKTVVVNCVECDPSLFSKEVLVNCFTADIVKGADLLRRMYPDAEVVFTVGSDRADTVAKLRDDVKGENIRVEALEAIYPQGEPHCLIKTLADIDYPASVTPEELGFVIIDIRTLFAVKKAVLDGEPSMRRVITVSGDAVKNPCEFVVRDGTSLAVLLEEAGGLKDGAELKKIIVGDHMNGLTPSSADVPAEKTADAVFFMTRDYAAEAEAAMDNCVRCGRCFTVCPIGLAPQMLAVAAEMKDYERFEKKLYGMECTLCGACSFICTARRPLTQRFRHMQQEILLMREAEEKEADKNE